MEGGIMADLRLSGLGGTPFGTTADRPASPSIGQTYYNGSNGLLEIYTASGWIALAGAPPAIPVNLTATNVPSGRAYNNGSASVAFSNGTGGGLSGEYVITSTPGNYFAVGSSSPIVVTGLQSNTSYTFVAQARNNFGTSISSSASSSITATTTPQAPTIGTATGLTKSASLSFTAGATGGLPITNYKYSTDGTTFIALSPAQTSSPLSIKNLNGAQNYTFYIKAVNDNGDSVASLVSNQVTVADAPSTLETLLVAGGGAGGTNAGAGGGAGGLYYNSSLAVEPGKQYNIVIGAGASSVSGNGTDSTISATGFTTITAIGGGGGVTSNGNGSSGGSGGGGSATFVGGSATQSSSSSGGFGNKGGDGNGNDGANRSGAGGGGAGAAGQNTPSNSQGGAGGIGLAYSIAGSSTYYAGGGGGSPHTGSGGSGGAGGGGAGGTGDYASGGGANGTAGTSNTGGGGGSGGGGGKLGANGGSGVAIIAYPSSFPAPTSITGSYDQPSRSGYRVYRFTGNGSITI
jgi:hypothetical protein